MNDMWHRARDRRDHRWAPGRMSDYVDGDLGARGRGRIERHVRECEECRDALTGLQRMLGKLRRMAAPAGRPDPRELAARVRERLTQHPES